MGFVLVTIDCMRLDDIAHITLPDVQAFPCVSVAPITSVACASILTGLYPPRHGIRNLAGYSLCSNVVTLAQIFGAAGYTTHAVVSGPPLRRHSGLQKGFDTYDDGFEDFKRPFGDVLDKCPDLRERDMFVWLHFFDLHPPYPVAGGSIKAVFDARHRVLGQMCVELEELVNQFPHHRFIVTGDHGEGFLGRQSPVMWLEHGERLDDVDVNVPLLLCRFENCWKPWAVRQVDILPTVCRQFGLGAPQGIDGVDIRKQEKEMWAYSESYLRPCRSFPDQKSIRCGPKLLVIGNNVFSCRRTEDMQEMMQMLDEVSQPPQDEDRAPSEKLREQLRALGYL